VTWIRLRQIALVVADLEATVESLRRAYGLKVAFHDPAVGAFGLRNAVLPIGSQFVEVLSPTRQATAAGRQIARAGGDSGYMVICHTDDHPLLRHRVDRLGVRIAFEALHDGFQIMQLHPSDTGGSFLEVDFQPGGDDPEGPWAPAGPSWQDYVDLSSANAISAVTISCVDPSKTSRQWAAILDAPLDGFQLTVDNATVVFEEGSFDALVRVRLNPATSAGIDPQVIGGVLFT
jgi:catechol 2,3-dioxygenase-like lactoylglutathione lyase family enzyme